MNGHKHTGFKIVARENGVLKSLQNPDITYSLEVGTVETNFNGGFYLGTSRDFVVDYYAGLTDLEDVLITYEYDEENRLYGNPNEEGEVIVHTAKILSIEAL